MTYHSIHHLKRLQHDVNSNLLPSPSTNYHSLQSRLPNDESVRESIHNFTISNENHTKSFRTFQPGPRHARRGGGRRTRDRHYYTNFTLPKRTINYDLAESFVDHSTNPLSSDLYKIKFKHSTKQWPTGRFENYKEQLNKLDGNPVEITCTRTFPIIAKRKNVLNSKSNEEHRETSLLTLADPMAQEEKKKQVDQQSTIYANIFGGGRIPKLSSILQSKKTNSTVSTASSNAVSLLDENVPKASVQRSLET